MLVEDLYPNFINQLRGQVVPLIYSLFPFLVQLFHQAHLMVKSNLRGNF
jgi:hypothetical protein